MKICPHCQTENSDEALVCKHCMQELKPKEENPPASADDDDDSWPSDEWKDWNTM